MPGNQSTSPLSPIGQQLAESIFVAKDDLVFSLPDDRTLQPAQHYGAAVESRSHVGAFSWFATIHRGSGYSHGTALLCIAVCHRRDLLDSNAERLVNVEKVDDENPTVPVAGDVSQRGNLWKLAARHGQPASDMNVKSGQWVMVAGIVADNRRLFQWHRVLAADEVLPAGQPDIHGDVSAVDTRSISTAGRACG
jgi:hypothetical protein